MNTWVNEYAGSINVIEAKQRKNIDVNRHMEGR
jgi:hypothetical protein